MQKRTLKVALLAVLAIVLVFGISTLALADQTWTDVPDTVTAKYGITDNQVAGISEGYPGNLWKPYQPVTRAQFTKMAVAAFNIPLATPATASFTDVPKGSYYYPYVEGAKAVGAVNGTSATTFGLNANITRQQAIAIVGRYIAKAQGFDLATMYTADEITALLQHFGDVASISADLKAEVAFAFDMGLTTGDDYGNINPLANLTRIQGAAFLIRAQGLVPPNLWIPAKLELVTADKSEGLIGQTYSVTFEVTDAAGHPAIGVLVDLDTMMATDYYVGNISPEAAVTNNYGQVTVNMLSLEPGTQRLSATVAGVGTVYTTRYWLALDEVYNTLGATAQNNAGVEHLWGARVVVFGPGPRSTSISDWYNAISNAPFDPTNVNVPDGVDFGDYWTYGFELAIAKYAPISYKPRTMAGIDVEWKIYDTLDNPLTYNTNEAVTSVGNIIAVDGTAVTPAKTAVGKTDANGLSTIKVYSEKVGKTLTQAVADYAGNPYPEELFNHDTFENDYWFHNYDWDDQPYSGALQAKTWISHTIGTPAGPIAPAYVAPNIGEEKTLTITLTDVYGNPVAGKYVEWYMQGVGFFNTDDQGDTSDPNIAANNKDFDVTNALGQSTVFVKSYDAGEQIVHAKYRDKGTGGAEGTWTEATAEVQWFDVDIATFDNITTIGKWATNYTDVTNIWDPQNEALSSNAVNDSHVFDLWVYGLKLEYAPTVDFPDLQTPFIDSDATGASYDGILDAKDAAYFGGILMWSPWYQQVRLLTNAGAAASIVSSFEGSLTALGYTWKYPLLVTPRIPTDLNSNGIIEKYAVMSVDPVTKVVTYADETGNILVKVGSVWMTLSFEGAYTGYDYDEDGYKELFTDTPGIYLPLAGKTVVFSKANEYFMAGYSNLGTMFDGIDVLGVGSFTPATAVTDAAGKASVTVTSTVKGAETIKAVVNWANNPHTGPQLVSAYAKKSWTAGTVSAATDVTIEVWIDGIKVATNKAGELAVPVNPTYKYDLQGNMVPNSAHVEVHVKDAYGNDLPDYEVVYLLESIDQLLAGSQNAVNTWIANAYLVDLDTINDFDGLPTVDSPDALYPDYDQNGTRPDSDEPMQQYDPYGKVVGAGGTLSFFFNQFLGSEKPIYAGMPGAATLLPRPTSWPTSGLATDGAKAWTLDGFYAPWLTGFIPTVTISAPATPIQATAVAAIGGSPLAVTSVIVTNGGSGYFTPPTVTFTLGGATVQATGHAIVSGGVVTSIVVDTAGTGYTSAPTVTIAAAPAPVAATATATVAGGVVTGVTLVTGGTGYMTAPTVTILAPPSGTAATATAAVNSAGQVASLTLVSGGSGYGTSSYGVLDANKLTGSNIDIQLASLINNFNYHYESILRVMVYAPANGLVKEGSYIWSTQVHKVWEAPYAASITVSQDVAVDADNETHQVTAVVKDQFGTPMRNQSVRFQGSVLEGGGVYTAMLDTWQNWTANPVTTDLQGKATATGIPVEWSYWNVRAYVDLDASNTLGLLEPLSNVITKYWANEVILTFGTPASPGGGYTLSIPISLGANLNGLAYNVRYDSPTGAIIGTGIYDNADTDALPNITSLSKQVLAGERVFVEFLGALTWDDQPNWVWDAR